MLRRRTRGLKTWGVMRAAFLILLLAGLCGCERLQGSAPFTEPRLPPGLSAQFWPPEHWGWGLIQVGDRPPIRYGVGAPQGESRADIVILPGHNDSAEAWFETARALIDSDFTVWILEGAGEGGSGREGRRDLAHLSDFEADIAALPALDRMVMRPRRGAAVIASGTAALTALAAVQRGYTPSTLILSGPIEVEGAGKPWTRPEPADQATPRRRAAQSWAMANPDLRMGGVSRAWRKARAALRTEVLAPESIARVQTPVLMLTPVASALPCEAMRHCREVVLKSSEHYPLASNAERDPWLRAILQALPR